jgi:hypothetical protein
MDFESQSRLRLYLRVSLHQLDHWFKFKATTDHGCGIRDGSNNRGRGYVSSVGHFNICHLFLPGKQLESSSIMALTLARLAQENIPQDGDLVSKPEDTTLTSDRKLLKSILVPKIDLG